MQRKPGFPTTNCSIKVPDSIHIIEGMLEEEEPVQRRQQLINFGHSEWGFNNWSWAVTKQDLDFVELSNGKFTAGVVTFVSVTVKSFDILRENVGYATSLGPNKGAAIHTARKCAVTNALRETLLSFGGNVALKLMEQLESYKANDVANQQLNGEVLQDNNQNLSNKMPEPKNIKQHIKADMCVPPAILPQVPMIPAVKNIVPPVAKAHPMPANLPSASRGPPANAPRPLPIPPPVPPPTVRTNPNEVNLNDPSEEARAERKRRQRQAQEVFRLKHLTRNNDLDKGKDSDNSVDVLMMAIPTQVILIESSGGDPAPPTAAKRRSVASRLDVVQS